MSDWRPSASIETLRARADLLARIRAFFAARGVMEVDTPILSAAATVDLQVDSERTVDGRWLRTSPEFPMKRLLAAGSGPIYELGHVFRAGVVGPRLGRAAPCFVHDFPASQAALARVREGTPPVAERFELFWQGLELANGFHELADAAEQRRRFESDQARRKDAGRAVPPRDERLLAALASGLPDCAGVALGVDRLLMLLSGLPDLAATMPFPHDRA